MERYEPEEVLNERPLVFLCGPLYDETDPRDRRTILRKYLGTVSVSVFWHGSTHVVSPFALVIDKIFNNDELEKNYNVTLIEEIVAACAYKNYIFVDSLSTALELGLFANSYSQNKTTALLPKDYALFRPSVGYFVEETIRKSSNISSCIYHNRRINKVIKDKDGTKRVIENLIAFPNIKRVPPELEREIGRDFQNDAEKYIIRFAFTQDTSERELIHYSTSQDVIKFIVPAKILFYLSRRYLESENTKAEIAYELTMRFGYYARQCRPEYNITYYRLLSGDVRVELNSYFQYGIDEVIDSMKYLLRAIGKRDDMYRQQYLRLRYATYYFWGKNKIPNLASLLNIGDILIPSLRNKTRAFTSKNLILNGKKRKIVMYANNSEGYQLRNIHVNITKQLGMLLPLSPYSYAYKTGRSTVACVEMHSRSRYFLKIDIKNFFNSISKRVMNKVIKCHLSDMPAKMYVRNVMGYGNLRKDYYSSRIASWADISSVLNLCFIQGKLPLGLVSSPFLSNLYLDFFDRRFVERFPNLVYTRYSDDMLISSSNPFLEEEVLTFVCKELAFLHLEINRAKVRKHELRNIGDHIKFLGISIVKGTEMQYLTVGKKYLQQISKDIADYEDGIGDKTRAEIRGEIAYIKMVSDTDFKKLEQIYTRKTNRQRNLDEI